MRDPMTLVERLPQIPVPDARSPSRLRFTMGAEGVLYVGQRIAVGTDFGTVKYIGPVPPTKGEWVGVEWDDPSRGKHDGSKDGVAYFECSSDTGGSFLRSHKLSTGISISQALVERYRSYNCRDGTTPGEELYFEDPESSQKTKVEVVGMEKVQMVFKNLKNLTMVGLRLENISHVGDEGFLLNQAPNIEDLDMSKNLFHEWDSIAKICVQLVNLRQLNLSCNVMQVAAEPALLRSSFLSLRTIVLNDCSLTWPEVTSCLDMWPQITELHLEKNKIHEIKKPANDLFSNLKLLNLGENLVKSWDEILNLSSLPCLEKFILNSCGLSEVKLSKDDFVTVKQISLSGNKFETTEVFNQLNNLQNLESLVIRNNPVLLEDTAETMREIIVAKIAKLAMLNRSAIDTTERQGAEMDYMKKYGRYWRESGGNQIPEKNKPSIQFQNDHPRYMEMIEIHGARDDAEFFIKSTALKSNLLDVTITVPEVPEIKSLQKKLPTSMTVGALKMMIFRLMKLPIKEQRLEYVSHQNTEHVVKMDKDNESLHYISLESGDTIQVKKRWADQKWSIQMYLKQARKVVQND